MASIQLDYSDITDIFKEKLKIGNIVKTVSSVFLNHRYSSKIDYKPYFQRNYVWDDEKATYFIESILLGTEIPPLVLFQTKNKNEVIDGRQRYETIKRFLDDKLILKEAGLHLLKALSGKKYSQLSDQIKEQFEDTRIRILQFQVVDEPKLDDEREDKIKKEIFRRYNSGITPLQREEIERAAYINDPLSKAFLETIYADDFLFDFLCSIILPKSKEKSLKRDKVNILVTRIRTLITLPYVPIYSYAHGSSKADIIHRYYNLSIDYNNIDSEITNFKNIIDIIYQYKLVLEEKNHYLEKNKLFYEVLYWGIAIVLMNGKGFSENDILRSIELIENASDTEELWERIINNPQKDVASLFEQTGSHYYSAINNRYNFMANILSSVCEIDYSKHLKNSDEHKLVMSRDIENEELKHYSINKPLPETLTIEDIISDMQKERFLIRPEYQRSEVKNVQKASYLMESILLGINIPPIFIYKRSDKIKEVVDGQQRILSILGFLGKTYKDERGEVVSSSKDKFKLSKLKILTDLNGKNIDTIDSKFEDKILEFPIDVIEIDSGQNPEFSQIDLFLRLNSKPYPIKENTFEMWNAYIDKDIIIKIRGIADKYAGKIFRAKDNRMKVEELITSLAYLDYRMHNDSIDVIHVLNIFKRNDRICSRIMSKDSVTRTLNDLSVKNPNAFLKHIDSVSDFAEKILLLIDNDPLALKNLFAHYKNGVQYKTDQNFYFIWIMLRNISVKDIEKHKNIYFKRINRMFQIIQNTPIEYTIENFLKDIAQIPNISPLDNSCIQ